MSNHLLVEDENGIRQLSLLPGITRLGSGVDCELRLEHEEVQPLALTLDFRGETLLVHNRNPYAVYLGDEELQPSQMAAWHENTPLRLTRSITVTLSGNGSVTPGKPAEEDEAPEKSPAFSRRQMIQLGIILLCLAVGYQQLTKEPTAAIEEVPDTFEDLRRDIAATVDESQKRQLATLAEQWQRTLRLLQEAHYLEIRPGQRDSSLAVEAYQRVLESEPIRGARPDSGDTLPSRVYRYATARKVHLDAR